VRAQWIIRLTRLAILLVFAATIGLALHRFRRTPEQLELTHYIEKEVPSLFSIEQPIDERIERLSRAPGLQPEAARALLVDEIIPRLIQLRRQAEGLPLRTDEAKKLNDEYIALTSQLVDACRACVQVIDDPKVPDAAGLVLVRERFADVRRAYQTWDGHVRMACVRNRLAPPTALTHP
jgi:hypothetical protein